ncbi:MAG: energy-coupling factor transporter transmembrane component T family protein [Solirubrobacteraceae bacterium]
MSYRLRSSPLHAAGAASAILWCLALLLAAMVSVNPVWLAAVVLTTVVAAWGAGVLTEVRRSLRFAVPLGISICVINALVTRDGLTVIWRFGDLPILGQTDVTLQATVYGAALGIRAVAVVAVASLYSAAVDPDQVLRLLRGRSFSSALAVTIANRMMPVLMRDSRRLADAQRCRPGRPPGRFAILQATTSGVVDRALDVAATLEVRGYALAPARHRRRSLGSLRGVWRWFARGRPPGERARWPSGEAARGPSGDAARGPSGPRPPWRRLRWPSDPRPPWWRLRWASVGSWDRHDIGFSVASVFVASVSVLGRVAGMTAFSAYPGLSLPALDGTLTACAVLGFAALLPFADRRGILR